MKLFRNVISTVCIIILAACSAPGPMKQVNGPLGTSTFDPIALDTVKDGSEQVYFKESAQIYEGDWIRMGVFFITDNGAYLAQWDTRNYIYNLKYRIDANDIVSASFDTYKRSFFPDTDLLVITDKDGGEAKFSLSGIRAAKSYLDKISGK